MSSWEKKLGKSSEVIESEKPDIAPDRNSGICGRPYGQQPVSYGS